MFLKIMKNSEKILSPSGIRPMTSYLLMGKYLKCGPPQITKFILNYI